MTSPVDIEEGLRLLAEATPGEWKEKKHGSKLRICRVADELTVANLPIGYMTNHLNDAALIAWAKTNLPSLLAQVKEMREALAVASDIMESQAGLLGTSVAFAPGVGKALRIAAVEARQALGGGE